jgi:hypothetical protein
MEQETPRRSKALLYGLILLFVVGCGVGLYFYFKEDEDEDEEESESPASSASPPASSASPPASSASPPASSPTPAGVPMKPDKVTKSTLPVVKDFKQDDYSMGWSSTSLVKNRTDWDGPSAITYSPGAGDVNNPNTGTLLTNFTVTAGSVYQINMSVGDLTIYNAASPVNKGPITLTSWVGNFVGDDLTTFTEPQKITISPGGPNVQWDLTFNLKIWQGGLLSFIVTVTDLADKLGIKQCTVKLLK